MASQQFLNGNISGNLSQNLSEDEYFTWAELELLLRENVSLVFIPKVLFLDMGAERLTIAVLYSLFFLTGVIGNATVIYIIVYLLCKAPRKDRCTTLIRLFVVSLSISDLLNLCQLPMVVGDICSGQWLFGNFACKIFWASDGFYKLTSSFLLLGISANNYLATCHSITYRNFASPAVAVAFVLSAMFCAAVLTVPILPYASVHFYGRLSGNGLEFEVWQEKCVVLPPESLLKSFLAYVFALHYCLSLAAQVKFNASMMFTLARSVGVARRRTSALYNRTRNAVVPLVAFYFTCWTPYWIINWTLVAIRQETMSANLMKIWTVLIYVLHSLPYFHSAVNPLLYSLFYKSVAHAYRFYVPTSQRITTTF